MSLEDALKPRNMDEDDIVLVENLSLGGLFGGRVVLHGNFIVFYVYKEVTPTYNPFNLRSVLDHCCNNNGTKGDFEEILNDSMSSALGAWQERRKY